MKCAGNGLCCVLFYSQVYVALLRTHQNEFKDLVSVALDTLVPALPKRLRQEDFVKAMKWTKKVVFEEGHSLPQLIHVWNLIVRHAALFYPFRSHFVPQMVSSISRLGLPPNCPVDHRQVAVGCAEVLIGWEYIRQQKLELKGGSGSADSKPSDHSDKEDEFSLHASMVQMLANFLVRLGLFVADSKDQALCKLSDKCIELYKTLVTIVSMKNIKVTYFERLLRTFLDNYNGGNAGSSKAAGKSSASTKGGQGASGKGGDGQTSTKAGRSGSTGGASSTSTAPSGGEMSERILCTFLQFLTASLEAPDTTSTLLYHNVTLVKDLLTPLFGSELLLKPNVNSMFRELVCQIFKCFPPADPAPLFVECGFYQHLKNVMDAAFRIDNADAALAALSRKPDARRDSKQTANSSGRAGWSLTYSSGWVLQLLEDMCQIHPSWIENHSGGVTMLCRQLLTIHLNQVSKAVALGDRKSAGAVAVSNAAGLTTWSGNGSKISCVYPTPHVAMATESISWNIAQTEAPGNTASDELISSMVLCVNILCTAIDRDLLNEQRGFTLSVLHAVLQVSDSHILLSLAVRYCCKWIAVKHSPLTVTEQAALFSNIVALDRWSLEMNAQSSIYRIVALVERVNKVPAEQSSWSERFLAQLPDLKSIALNNYGLMCTDNKLRGLCIDRLMSQFGTDSMTLHEKVVMFVRMNWHCNENRYWLSALPSLLLAGGKVTFAEEEVHSVDEITAKSGRGSANDDSSVLRLSAAAGHPIYAFLNAPERSDSDVSEYVSQLALLNPSVADCIWHACSDFALSQVSADDHEVLAFDIAANIARHDYRGKLVWPHQLFDRATQFGFADNVPKSIVGHFLSRTGNGLFPIDFLGAVGCGYGFWHLVCDEIINDLQRSEFNQAETDHAIRVMVNTLRDVGDSESVMEVYRQFGKHPSTKQVLALQSYDFHSEAQIALFKSMNSTLDAGSGEGEGEDGGVRSPLELEMWEERWLESARNLSQWDIVAEYGESTSMLHTSLEAAGMLRDWSCVRRLKASSSFDAQCDRGNYNFKLLEGMLTIVDQKYPHADKLYSQAVQMSLSRWCALPSAVGGSNSIAHKELLHFFHRAVELRESIGIMVEVTTKATKDKSLPDLKGNLAIWRERLPEPCDSLVHWDGVLRWRTHVFSLIESIFQNVSDESQLASLHDSPWTVVTLARAARKHRLEDVSMQTLSRLNSVSTMDVQDVYTKLREQILVCLTDSQEQLYNGVNIINSTNLEYFDATQKAELFRLKAQFQVQIGLDKDAELSFSQSVQMCPSFGKGWTSWSDFCYARFKTSGLTEDAHASIVCIVKAIESNYQMGQILLSRALWLVACADDSEHTLANALKTRTATLPTWMWLPFLSSLFGSLRRPEKSHTADMLCEIAAVYPEAVLHLLVSPDDETSVCSPEELACHHRIYEAIAGRHPTIVKESKFIKRHISQMLEPNLVTWKLSSLLDSLFNTVVNDYRLRWDELVPDRACELLSAFLSSHQNVPDSFKKEYSSQIVSKRGKKCTVLEVCNCLVF
jgi:hypothetical protein